MCLSHLSCTPTQDTSTSHAPENLREAPKNDRIDTSQAAMKGEGRRVSLGYRTANVPHGSRCVLSCLTWHLVLYYPDAIIPYMGKGELEQVDSCSDTGLFSIIVQGILLIHIDLTGN